jgi:hypothetical protein
MSITKQEVCEAIAELERLVEQAELAYEKLVEADEDEYDG